MNTFFFFLCISFCLVVHAIAAVDAAGCPPERWCREGADLARGVGAAASAIGKSAVHDRRTALRHLLALLDALRDDGLPAPLAPRRTLKRAMTSLGRARDSDVARLLLKSVLCRNSSTAAATTAAPLESVASIGEACASVRDAFAALRADAGADLAARAAAVDAAAGEVRAHLATACACNDHVTSAGGDAARFLGGVSAHVRRLVSLLRSRLAHALYALELPNPTAEAVVDVLHAARVASKKLRFLLQLLLDDFEGGACRPAGDDADSTLPTSCELPLAVLGGLQRLQASIGVLHDWHELAATIDEAARQARAKSRSGLVALGAAAAAREAEALSAVATVMRASADGTGAPAAPMHSSRGGGHARDFVDALVGNATALFDVLLVAAPPPARRDRELTDVSQSPRDTASTAGGEAPAAKLRGVEIERRWLLTALPPALSAWLDTDSARSAVAVPAAVDAAVDASTACHGAAVPSGDGPSAGSPSCASPLEPPLLEGIRLLHLEAGYIPGRDVHERLRRSTECRAAAGAASATCHACDCGACGQRGAAALPPGCSCVHSFARTVKSGAGITRLEAEDDGVDPALFDLLWAATEGHRVCKRRFVVPAGPALTWEIDEVLQCTRPSMVGTVILEIELPTPDARVPSCPDWLASYVGREATDTFSTAADLAGMQRVAAA